MIVSVTPPSIPDKLAAFALDAGLSYKGEFHLRITSFALDEERPDVQRVARTMRWDEIVWTDEFYFVSRHYPEGEHILIPHIRHSIIQVVQCPQLIDLYDLFDLETPFPHVTLFVGTNNQRGTKWQQGIGFPKSEEMKKINV